MDKLSICKEFPQTYEFFKDLKCSAFDDIIEHPDFIPTLILPVWEEHFTFANQNLDKQSYRILKGKFENISKSETFMDVFAELLTADFLFKNIHPRPIVEFIKEIKSRTPDIKTIIKSQNVSIYVEVTRMSSESSHNDQLEREKLSQNEGKMIDVTEFRNNSFAALIDKLKGKKSQFCNCMASFKIFVVVSNRFSMHSRDFEHIDRYYDLKSDFGPYVDGILYFGCYGEKKLIYFNSNLKDLISNVEYYGHEN